MILNCRFKLDLKVKTINFCCSRGNNFETNLLTRAHARYFLGYNFVCGYGGMIGQQKSLFYFYV